MHNQFRDTNKEHKCMYSHDQISYCNVFSPCTHKSYFGIWFALIQEPSQWPWNGCARLASGNLDISWPFRCSMEHMLYDHSHTTLEMVDEYVKAQYFINIRSSRTDENQKSLPGMRWTSKLSCAENKNCHDTSLRNWSRWLNDISFNCLPIQKFLLEPRKSEILERSKSFRKTLVNKQENVQILLKIVRKKH